MKLLISFSVIVSVTVYLYHTCVDFYKTLSDAKASMSWVRLFMSWRFLYFYIFTVTQWACVGNVVVMGPMTVVVMVARLYISQLHSRHVWWWGQWLWSSEDGPCRDFPEWGWGLSGLSIHVPHPKHWVCAHSDTRGTRCSSHFIRGLQIHGLVQYYTICICPHPLHSKYTALYCIIQFASVLTLYTVSTWPCTVLYSFHQSSLSTQ